MVDIDYILDLFDWNKSEDDQRKGLQLAQNVKCISAFIQPGSPYGKNVWENCAKALAERNDLEITPHVIELLEWLQDMNWPGAYCILERLQQYTNACYLKTAINICLKKAILLDDKAWEMVLKDLLSSTVAQGTQ